MQRETIIEMIKEHLQACTDENLLDFILQLFLESGY